MITTTEITASTPAHDAGAVDVVVTNPGGASGTLTHGYTFRFVVLHASPNPVAPGAPLTVTWAAPGREFKTDDWIGLFPVGAPSGEYENYWWRFVSGAPTTVVLTAPTTPGEYELRYLPDDLYIVVERTSVSVRE